MTKVVKRDTKALGKALVGRTIVAVKDKHEDGVLDIRFDNDTALIIHTSMFGLATVKPKEKPMEQ